MKDTEAKAFDAIMERRWARVDDAMLRACKAGAEGDLNTLERILFSVNRSPDAGLAGSGRFANAQAELAKVRRDLIALFDSDPESAASRVRRIAADQRRLWMARWEARREGRYSDRLLATERPRLRKKESECNRWDKRTLGGM